jgi:hypothetical protein
MEQDGGRTNDTAGIVNGDLTGILRSGGGMRKQVHSCGSALLWRNGIDHGNVIGLSEYCNRL